MLDGVAAATGPGEIDLGEVRRLYGLEGLRVPRFIKSYPRGPQPVEVDLKGLRP